MEKTIEKALATGDAPAPEVSKEAPKEEKFDEGAAVEETKAAATNDDMDAKCKALFEEIDTDKSDATEAGELKVALEKFGQSMSD